MKKAHLFMVAALLLGAAEAAWFRPRLPDRIAVHFDLWGRADGWGDRDRFLLGFAILPALLIGLLGALRPLLRRVPDSLINMPNKEYWLAPERRAQTLERIHGLVAVLVAMALLLLDGHLWLALQAASSETERLSVGWTWGLVAAFVAASVGWMVRASRGFRRTTEGA